MIRYASILNSRQSKFPCGDDGWVKNTVSAVRDAINRDFTILSSVGMNTYELVLWAANHFGGRQLIVYPLSARESEDDARMRAVQDFRLDEDRVDFKFIPFEGGRRNWLTRDREIVHMSYRAYLISLREKSTFFELLKTSDAEVVLDYRTVYARRRVPRYRLNFDEIEQMYPSSHWAYLTHWTRSHSGPWRGESKADYYLALYESGSENPRSARKTLQRIKMSGVILASSDMVRGDVPVVSFTELAPADAMRLMVWRTGLGRYNFEPFGVAVKKDVAIRSGVRPVEYGDEKKYKSLSDEERVFFQPLGAKNRWHREVEWRHIGDFKLSTLPGDSYFFIELA